jgi:TolB protein
LRRLTTDHFGYALPDVSPDGRRITFASRGSGEWAIYIMNADGTGRTKLVQRSAFDGSPRWSPDGSRIAFRSENETAFGRLGRIFVINVDGTGLRQVSPEDPTLYYYDDSPTWSPDGSKIAFSRTGLLYVINADGTGLTALPAEGVVGSLDWSPDGTRLVYGNQADDGNIFLIDPDGANPVALTATPEYDDQPRWSPDGGRVVFCRVVNEDHFELFVINRDGTGEYNLAVGCPASWSRVQ